VEEQMRNQEAAMILRRDHVLSEMLKDKKQRQVFLDTYDSTLNRLSPSDQVIISDAQRVLKSRRKIGDMSAMELIMALGFLFVEEGYPGEIPSD